jgi:hypothetical protein
LLSLNAPVISLSMQNISIVNWWVKISKNPINDGIKFISLGILIMIAMSFNKLISVCAILFICSCQKGAPLKTIVFGGDQFEVLNSRVKQVISIKKSLTGIFSPVDTIWFDENGNVLKKRTSSRLGEVKATCVTEYRTNGEKLRTIEKDTEYAFGRVDDISRSIFKYGSSAQINYREDYYENDTSHTNTHYKYDVSGDCVEVVMSNKLGVEFSENRKYQNHLMIQAESYFYKGKNKDNAGKDIYHYLAFDKNGNWTRRMIVYNGEKEWLETRKITYY